MKFPFKTSVKLIAGFASGITITGLLTYGVLIIPTDFGKHEAKLTELHVGTEWATNNPIITLDANNNVLIAGGMTAGGTNKNEGENSTIAWGTGNTITTNGKNSTIVAGRENSIFAPNATIGAGIRNIINPLAEWSFIGGWEQNEISGKYSSIAGGRYMNIWGNYSVIVGGNDHTISSDYSIALGEATNIQHRGTFTWSDYNDTIYRGVKLTSTKNNTFLIRSLNGMGINTNTSPDGVNVNVNGSVYLGGTTKLISSGTINTSCNSSIMGTFETLNGCYYFCDGKYWQIVNMPFEGDDVAKNCAHNNVASKTCYLDGFNLRAGDTFEAYNVLSSNNCTGAKTTVTCKVDGTLDKPAYKYANCFPT